MGTVQGNFRVLRPDTALAFTGERMTTAVEGQIEFEHLHRYCLARDLCAGRDVLDVASGEGYGAAILAGPARSVVGVEIDPASVAHARTAYALPNLRFEEGDAQKLPLPDDSVDLVVSFETLEHLDDPPAFLAEVRRVLRPGGLVIISTPDRGVYSAPGSDANPYHRVEYTPEEFAAELGRHFPQLALYRQRPVLGSAMVPLDPGTAGPGRTYERRGPDIVEASGGLARAPYLIALAGDGELPAVGTTHYLDRRSVHRVCEDLARLPALETRLDEAERALEESRAEAVRDRVALTSTLTEAKRGLEEAARRETALSYDIEDLRATAARLPTAEARAAEIERRLRAAEARADAAATEIRALRDTSSREAAVLVARADAATAAERAETETVRRELEHLAAHLRAVQGSTSWKLLAPLRIAGRRMPRAARAVRRTARLVWWTATLQLGTRYLERRAARRQLAAERSREETLRLAAPESASAPPIAPETAPPAPAVDLRRDAEDRDRGQPIRFPADAPPRVSVIIPVYGNAPELRACLRAMAATVGSEPPFEVILADDKPDDRATADVPPSPGLRILDNPENLGFLRTCNRAAARAGAGAGAEFLLFLNSDTLVQPGWLRALVAAADAEPRAAIVGSMLLNTDGTIQDAGWRILGDGWGHPLGRGATTEGSAHTYRREADCVTGASLLVRRSAFEALGGFDDAYAPAFYEEFDLAFRARARGWLTLYEPGSRVVHLGSASYGAAERDRLSARNHGAFVERFADRLRRQPWGDTPEFLLRRLGDPGPAILVVDDTLPRPDRHAGAVTLTQYLGLMAGAGWRVVFAPYDGVSDSAASLPLRDMGIEVLPGGAEAIAAWLAENGRHLRNAWVARPGVAPFVLPAIRAHSSAFVAYYTHDLHHRRLRQEATLTGNPAILLEAEETERAEVAIFRGVDCVMSCNEEESEIIRGLSPGTRVVTVPPYYVAEEDAPPRDAARFAALRDIVFVGGFPHLPNVDSALFTAREVMPLVWERVPDARLVLVGYAPPPEVRALADDPRIVVTGQVPDLAPCFLGARLSLAALRYGAGVKGKVVQALAFATPLVTTPVGAEGLGLEPGEHALVAEDAAGLAEAAVSLLLDADRCASLGAAGQRFIRGRLSRTAMRRTLDEVYGGECCRVCGSTRFTSPEPPPSTSEGFACLNCYALARTAALATVMVQRYGSDGSASLAELSRTRRLPRTLEIGFAGAIAEILRGDPAYSDCEYFEAVPLGQPGPGDVRSEDVTRLTFPDGSFDLVISQEVMEHVPDARRGFEEMRRVLRPGGRMLFTTPVDWRRPDSVVRAVVEKGRLRHLAEPAYHGDPVRAEGALVFTDWGADIVGTVEGCGLNVSVHRVPIPGTAISMDVFEAVRTDGSLHGPSQGDAPA